MTDEEIFDLLRDIKPDVRGSERFRALSRRRSTISARTIASQETRDIITCSRLLVAATELAEREQLALDNQIAFHKTGMEDEEHTASHRALRSSAEAAGEAARGWSLRRFSAVRSCRRSPACSSRRTSTWTRRRWS